MSSKTFFALRVFDSVESTRQQRHSPSLKACRHNGAQGPRFPQVPCASELLIGIAKAQVGYFGAWASVQFDLQQFLGRLALTAAPVLFHSLALAGLRDM